MTPQEKEAKRIFDLFKLEGNYLQGREDQKKQALICVREIKNKWQHLQEYLSYVLGDTNPNLTYWKEVEQILKEKY